MDVPKRRSLRIAGVDGRLIADMFVLIPSPEARAQANEWRRVADRLFSVANCNIVPAGTNVEEIGSNVAEIRTMLGARHYEGTDLESLIEESNRALSVLAMALPGDSPVIERDPPIGERERS